nr:hypothetical protein Iba_chr04fCG4920 [Ipomoea batatas]
MTHPLLLDSLLHVELRYFVVCCSKLPFRDCIQVNWMICLKHLGHGCRSLWMKYILWHFSQHLMEEVY